MQIRLHRLQGSNALTYGDFDFTLDGHTVSQLIGKNGSGKSSIPVILEEILYNNNSRGFKKDEFSNRNTDEKGWWGEVTLSVGEDLYVVRKDVKSTAKVKLTCNGEDISGHTATQTYKLIKDILGSMEFKTFSKLVYQSIESSLDFLTATDANRKKFLVSLLGLEHYAEIEKELKEHYKEANSSLKNLQGRMTTVESWLKRNKEVPSIIDEIEVPEVPESLDAELMETQVKLRTSQLENDQVDKHNNRVKEYETRVQTKESLHKNVLEAEKLLPAPTDTKKDEIQSVTRDLTKVQTQMDGHKKLYQQFKADADKTNCPTCGSHLDTTQQAFARDEAKNKFVEAKPLRDTLQGKLEVLQQEEKKYQEYAKAVKALDQAQNRWENYEVGEEVSGTKHKTDASSLQLEVNELRNRISKHKSDNQKAIEHNTDAKVSNAKREQLLVQLEENNAELAQILQELEGVEDKVTDLSILADAFGSKGLISYKIESNVKVFEDLINKYLSKFTSGQFALSFELDETKLQVVIYDNGTRVSMHSLSSGEKSKVNISTLLAIRNLMSIVSKTELNVLFLDEIISVLDTGSMESLIEIMLKEYHLNTFIVSHGFEHPLTQSIQLEKVNGVSKVIYG